MCIYIRKHNATPRHGYLATYVRHATHSAHRVMLALVFMMGVTRGGRPGRGETAAVERFTVCDGHGTYTSADGDKYEGEWENGNYNERVTYTWTNGDKYEGEWENNKRHGRGTYTWAIGNKYEGEWKNAKKHGRGTYTWANGDKYEGEWKNGKHHGRGTYIWASGNKYDGEWENGKKHGRGTKTWVNGDKYEGEWKNDKHHGRGTYIWASGNKYDGEWENGKKHGHGTKTWADGEKYEGEWQSGKYHGHGTYTWANGDKYEGEWMKNKRHGRGTYTWANGDKYEGEWKNGKHHGRETETLDNGDKYEGEWLKDKKHGRGTETLANGDKYEGEWKNGKPQWGWNWQDVVEFFWLIWTSVTLYLRFIVLTSNAVESVMTVTMRSWKYARIVSRSCVQKGCDAKKWAVTSMVKLRVKVNTGLRCLVQSYREAKNFAARLPAYLLHLSDVFSGYALGEKGKVSSHDTCECCLCFESYNDARPARILECGHTFCELCLRGMLALRNPCDCHHKMVACPTCRSSTKVLHGDASNIIRNFDLESSSK